VERGSTSAGYDTGDQITVREALYAMLLKSANEVANALAEHCAGSIEAFAELMNEKAAELGCTDSHFANPSGLNDPNHYTTAYDFALISKAAFENPLFVEFDSTTYHEMAPNATNKEPFTVYCGHKMMKKNSGLYYPGIIGGKTGYTTLAGNTLVTCVERDGLKLITVVLNGHQTHYTDTQALLDFGFANFKNVNISDYETTYTSPESDIDLTGNHSALLQLDTGRSVTLPRNAEFSDASTELSYELSDKDPGNAAARLTYLYDGRVIGTTWLLASQDDVSIAPNAVPGTAGTGESALHEKLLETVMSPDIFQKVLIGLIILLIIAAAAALVLLARHIFADSSRDDIRFSESMRRLQEQNTALSQENIYRDSSSSVDHYLPDSRLNSKSKNSRWFKRKG
jgi:D-alanyl-D-alanine carboxypeptidase